MLALAILLVLSMAPAVWADDLSGQCGENVTWRLDNGWLIISGSGAMTNYSTEESFLNAPWIQYKDNIKNVRIEAGVTTVGDNSFVLCNELSSVTLPDTITSIGNYAFMNCGNLKSINLPDSVTSIGKEAFSHCPALEVISIPDSVTSIGETAFGWTGLRNVVIPNSVTIIEPHLFYMCTDLNNVKISNNTTSIGDGAFYGCYDLTNIEIPSSVTSIENGAFSYCVTLQNLDIPNSVTNIGEGLFNMRNSTSALTSVRLPNGIVDIPARTFLNCGKLSVVNIPDSVKNINNQAFLHCSSLTSIDIPISVELIDEYAFNGCENLKDIYYAGNKEQWDSIIIRQSNEPIINATIHYLAEDNPSEDIPVKFYPENGKNMDLDNPANGTSSVNYADNKLRIFFDKELANSGGNRADLDFSVGALEIRKVEGDSVVYTVQSATDLPFWGENGVYNKAVRLENATAKLEYGTQYYVTMPAGFIKFADGTTSPAINKGDWSFITKDKSGNIPEIKPVTEVNVEIPKDGFAVVVMDETFTPINGATVTAQNLPMSPSAKTDNGIVTFNRLPDGAKDTATVRIKVEMDGYPTLLVPREVKKGSLVSVVYKKSDDLQIYSVEGTIDGVTKDLLYNYCYFKENVNKVEAAEDKRNVKEFVISVGTSGNTHIDKYQIIQNGKVVLESKSPIIKIPVYTGTPTVPDSFGSNYLIDTLKAGQNVYLRLVDDNGNVSKQAQLAIKISQPSKATEVFPDGKGGVDIGKKLKINVPSNIPILGDSELEFGLDEIPFQYQIFEDGKVRFALNPPKSWTPGISTGHVNGLSLEEWKAYGKEYDEVFEQIGNERLSAGKAFGAIPQGFKAGNFKANANVMGYGEGYVDDNGNIYVDLGIIVTLSEKASFTATTFFFNVPVYFSLGEEGEVKCTGKMSLDYTNGKMHVTGLNGEMELSVDLNPNAGVGLKGIVSAELGGHAKLIWLNRFKDDYNRINFKGNVYISGTLWLWHGKKDLLDKEYTLYDSNKNIYSKQQARALTDSLYDEESYKPINRSYLYQPMAFASNQDVVKANVYPNAAPQLVQVNGISYLFWLDDIASRADNDRTALVYATSNDMVNWSAPQQIIAETSNSTADFVYDLCVDGDVIHIALCKANQQFGDREITLNDMAISSDVYYTNLDTASQSIANLQCVAANNYANIIPNVVVNNGQVMVVYAENQMEDGFFGIDNTYQIVSVPVTDVSVGTASRIKVDGLLSSLDAGVLDGQTSINYIVDKDNNYQTEDDLEIWLATNGMATQLTNNEIAEFSPSFAQIGGTDVLMWYSNGNIYYVDTVNAEPQTVLEENGVDAIGSNFYVINDGIGNAKIVWMNTSNDETADTMMVYATVYKDSSWSKVYPLKETDSLMTSVLSGYSVGDKDYIAYLCTTNITEDDYFKELCVTEAEAGIDISLLNVDYDLDKVLIGETIPLNFIIHNNGGKPVDNINIFVDDNPITSIIDADLGIGETKIYSVDSFVVPENLNALQTLTAQVETSGDINTENNSYNFNIGYTDVSITAKRVLVNGTDWADISIVNESKIITDVTLQIFVNSIDSTPVYTKDFNEIDRENAQAVMLSLAEFTKETNASVIYAVVTANKDELITSNNTDLIYLGGNLSQYTLTVIAGAGGTVTNDTSGNYLAGANININAVPNTGYEFVNWSSSNGGTFENTNLANPNCKMPANEVIITANFRKLSSSGGSSNRGSRGYAVSVNSVEGGKISVTPKTALKDDTVTINVTPDNGYKLDSLTVKDSTGKSVELTKVSDKKYTFVMPDGKVSVNAIFVKVENEQPEKTSKTFIDVPLDAWFFKSVAYVTEKGIMNGYEDGHFGPNDNTTRGQIVTVLYRLEGETTIGTSKFSDVGANQYYTKAVAWAATNGIVNGYTDTKFAPDDNVTREQLAAILFRYAKFKGYDISAIGNIENFADSSNVSSWAKDALVWNVGVGLINGDNGALRPQGNATRAEIATLLMRFVENISK